MKWLVTYTQVKSIVLESGPWLGDIEDEDDAISIAIEANSMMEIEDEQYEAKQID